MCAEWLWFAELFTRLYHTHCRREGFTQVQLWLKGSKGKQIKNNNNNFLKKQQLTFTHKKILLAFCSTMRLCIQCLEMRYLIVKLLHQHASKSFQVQLSDHKSRSSRFTLPIWKKIDYSVTKALYLDQLVVWPNYDWTSVGKPHLHVTWTKVQDWFEYISNVAFLSSFWWSIQPVLFICWWPGSFYYGP